MDSANRNPTDAIVALEHRVWDAWRARDLDALSALTAPDYVAVDPEGLFDWPSVQKYLLTSELVSYDIAGMHARELSADAVALAFRVRAEVGRTTAPRVVEMSVLSVWVRRQERWLSVVRHEMPLSQEIAAMTQQAHPNPT
jgi:ketosteroid isomerase-like protein